MAIIYNRFILGEYMDVYQKVIASSRYARHLQDKQRRETWDETVDRLILFIKEIDVSWRSL